MDFEKDLFDEVARDFDSRILRHEQIDDELSGLGIEAESEDGLIRLTVSPSGHLRRLELDPRVKRLDVETLAEQILNLVNDAFALLQEEISDKLADLMPDFRADQLMQDFLRLNRPPESA